MTALKEPAVLFFILGVLSVFLRTHLEVSSGLSKFLSLYLLLAIGFKGGLSLSKTGISEEFFYCLTGGVLIAVILPILVYFFFSRRLSNADAAGVAATYGSVSAVTFIAGVTWLESNNIEHAGYMIAILALMEAPAIVVSLLLYGRNSGQKTLSFKILHEAFFNSSVFLLLGSVAIGLISGPFGKESVGTLVFDLFKGLLCFFLLDLGIKSGRAIAKLQLPLWVCVAAIFIPLIGASLSILWSFLFQISAPQAFLLTTMAAGASYIAVPAALQFALPQANSGIFLTMSLGITFPFNIILGLPLYWRIITALL